MLFSSCRCLGIGASVPLRCPTGRSSPELQGHLRALGDTWERPQAPTLPPAETGLKSWVSLLSASPSSNPLSLQLPFLSRPRHGWQSLFGSTEVLLSWILGKIFSWEEWSGSGTDCPGRWQSHHPRTEHMWPLVVQWP